MDIAWLKWKSKFDKIYKNFSPKDDVMPLEKSGYNTMVGNQIFRDANA